jgi:hypothetical protein
MKFRPLVSKLCPPWSQSDSHALFVTGRNLKCDDTPSEKVHDAVQECKERGVIA